MKTPLFVYGAKMNIVQKFLSTANGQLWLAENLKANHAKVTFIKKDGTTRVMKCTLKEDDIIKYETKTDVIKEQNKEVLPVFDLEKQEWRSFRYDSVIEVEIDD